MLSSRNLDLIPDDKSAVTLEIVRRELQKELQDEKFCGFQLLDVWINEEAGAEDGSADAWDQCMDQVDQADVLVVIYNGHAGWTSGPGDVGICHAEAQRAYDRQPSKVWLIRLNFPSNPKFGLVSLEELACKNPANQRFAEYLKVASRFRGQASDRTSLKEQVRRAVVKAVTDLAATGSREGRKGRYDSGQPLEWSRLSYQQRKEALEIVAGKYLCDSQGGRKDKDGFLLQLDEKTILVKVHGVPAGFGIAEARDLVGRPYLRDHETCVGLDRAKVIGPVHIIACHKSCTESQAISFIGHPDVFIVPPQFGLFVADLTSFVQVFFLTQCRDETATVVRLQRLFEWIGQSRERQFILTRARSRQKILAAMAKEIAGTKGGR